MSNPVGQKQAGVPVGVNNSLLWQNTFLPGLREKVDSKQVITEAQLWAQLKVCC